VHNTILRNGVPKSHLLAYSYINFVQIKIRNMKKINIFFRTACCWKSIAVFLLFTLSITNYSIGQVRIMKSVTPANTGRQCNVSIEATGLSSSMPSYSTF